MGLLNRIFGTDPSHASTARPPSPAGTDAYALDRYRYMLQTAPPETLEQAHAEAFERLTPEQRRQVLEPLAAAAPLSERGALERPSDDPRSLARAATRAERQQPGIVERTLGTSPGSGFGAGLLGSFALAFAGSQAANAFFAALAGSDDFDGFDGFAGDELGAPDDDGAGPAGRAPDDDGSLAGVGDLGADLDGVGGFEAVDLDL